MPYFSWVGVDLENRLCYNKNFAKSQSDLILALQKENINLIDAKCIKLSLFSKFIIKKSKLDFVNNLSILLKSNLHLQQALKIIETNIKNYYFKEIIKDINLSITNGKSLEQAFSCHFDVFDELTRSILSSGQKSSNLVHAIEKLNEHNQVMENFNQKIKSSLMMPTITLLFFVIVLFMIFLFVIPKFEVLFSSFNQDLPRITKIIILISRMFKFDKVLLLFLSLSISVYFLPKFFKQKFIKSKKHKIYFILPSVKYIFKILWIARFTNMLNMLCESGIFLTEALSIIHNSIENDMVKKEIEIVRKNFESGKPLSISLSKTVIFNEPDFISLINIGEASDLNSMVFKASVIYQNRVYAVINNLTFFIGPILLLVLGIFISCLIFAVYVPIFTLSSIVTV